MRENNLIQNISWYCWPFFSAVKFYIHCHLKILGLTKTAISRMKLSGCRYIFGHKSLVKSAGRQYSQASQSNQVAYYATNNPNHVFFLFFLSFLKVCFHTILNKSKNIVFHVNFPPLPRMCL